MHYQNDTLFDGIRALEPEMVKLGAYALGKYEVTFEEYDRFVAATGRDQPSDASWGRGKHPVINVGW